MTEEEASRQPLLGARHIAAIVAGNALEFYDFLIFSFFAIPIGKTFFPSHVPGASLLAALATFGAGFLTRPLGGVFIGMLADRAGRKPAMQLSFALMGVSMLGMACTPGFAAIGVAAPLLVIVWRLLQGFAIGGEVGATTATLVEGAPAHRRGLFAAVQTATQQAAVTMVGIVGFVLSGHLSTAAMESWGWRMALGAGLLVVPVGLVIRTTLPETREVTTLGDGAPTVGVGRLMVVILVIIASTTVGTYVLNTLTTYAVTTLKMDPGIGFAAALARGLSGVIFALISGAVSDRIGRRWPTIVATAGSGVLALPLLLLVTATKSPAMLLISSAVLGALVAGASVPILSAAIEALPARWRAGAMGTLYALAIAVFGGSTPFVVTWLTEITHDPLTPGWYLVAASIMGLIALVFLPETAPSRKRNTHG